MKKALVLILTFALVLSFAACGQSTSNNANSASPEAKTSEPAKAQENAPASTEEKVKIIIANGKGELMEQYAQAITDFMATHENIEVEQYTGAVGDTMSILDKMTASGVTVSLAMIEPGKILDIYPGWGIDLSNEKWVEQTDSAFKDTDGAVIGFPFAIEGFGLVYNKKVVENAIGGSFDPFTINTRDKLIELLDKIKASGIEYPVAYQTDDWSVGNHYSSQFLNQDDPFKVIEKLKKGELDLKTNEVWNGYYDTMDTLVSMKYNKYGERPLGMYYDDAHLAVGKGESAMLFNGNWAYDSLQAVAGDEFGFIPVPVDNNPDNPLNNKLVCGPTQVYLINAKATPEQQEAAKEYLNWLVFDEAGQDFMVNKSQIVSAFKNNQFRVTNPLGIAISEAVSAGKTVDFSTNYVNPSDYMTILGADVQKYIDKKMTREDLASAFMAYYTK